MATKTKFKTTFEVGNVIQPIYNGGPVALSHDAKLLVTSLNDAAILTDLSTGENLGKIEGVSFHTCFFVCWTNPNFFAGWRSDNRFGSYSRRKLSDYMLPVALDAHITPL